METLRPFPRALSCEFFPPKTPEGAEKLRNTWQQLSKLHPKFFSVTYGAAGSTRERTLSTVLEILGAGLPAVPHLSCVGMTRAELAATLELYQSKGVGHIVALRGDASPAAKGVDELRYANELVAFIRDRFDDAFRIEVACYPEVHPEAKSARDDLLAFKQKIDAGAHAAITQYFYDAEAYYRFVGECDALGITIPIVPGIMPIGNFSQLMRFSNACGAKIPHWLKEKLESYGDDTDSVRALGLDVVTELCSDLLDHGAPGLHFYTLNQAALTTTIWQRLGL
jgi:methylenetetrahydrofolate reductase (NADPH)